jgi:cell division protein YceG involved in septum cleavage
MKRRLHRFISFILLFLFAVACGGGLRFYAFLETPASDAPREFILSIAPGSGFDRVAYDLQKEGAVADVALFRLLARLEGSLHRVQAGDYRISTGWTPDRLLRWITGGKALLYRLSVREGLSWWETAASVEQQGFARFEDFRDVIRDPEFLREHNIPFADAEGFLFPETYLLPKPRDPPDREQARQTASHMVRMFWKKTEALWSDPSFMKKSASDLHARSRTSPDPAGTGTGVPPPAQRDASGPGPEQLDGSEVRETPEEVAAGPGPEQLDGSRGVRETPEEVAAGPRSPAEVDAEALRRLVILASLVEKETGLPEERALVAGVFANRLRLGMLLQCDPTIVYGIGESFEGRIRRSQIDDGGNPYNTYRHAGLPPGPICSPGLEALKAAFTPADHDFLYFVARNTGDGHNFSKTLNEHNRAVQSYRERPRGNDNTP